MEAGLGGLRGARISRPAVALSRNSAQIDKNVDTGFIRHSFCTGVLEMCV
jgi:site-specific recombinase XerD